MFALADLLRVALRSLFADPRDEWDALLEMKQQRDDARAALEACREHKTDILTRSIALAMRVEVAEEETRMLRRCLAVRDLDVPAVPMGRN